MKEHQRETRFEDALFCPKKISLFFTCICHFFPFSPHKPFWTLPRFIHVGHRWKLTMELELSSEHPNMFWYRILLSAKYYLSKSSSSWNQQIFYLRVITTDFHIFAIVNSLIGHYCQFISTFILEFLFFLGNFLGFFISLPSYCLFYHTIKLDASYICLLNTYGCFSSSFKYAQAKVYGYFSE